LEEKDNIIKLLSESKIKLALEKIQGHLDNLSSKDKKKFLMIKKQWYGLKSDFSKGIITHEQYSSGENRIVDSLLDFLESKSNEKSNERRLFKKYQIARILKYALLVFGILIIFFAIFKFVDRIIPYKELSSGLKCNMGLEDIEKTRFKPDTIYQYEDLDLDKVSLKINDQVIRSINFSISNKYGEIDIIVMWLELIKMHSCVPADFYLERVRELKN
jgi:hypothetical protein